MKKKALSLLLALCLCLSLLPGTAWAADPTSPWTGTGTEDDPYQISSKDKLAALATQVNGGTAYSGVHFTLTADIDLQGSESNQWTPIGTQSAPFSGVFDGGGHTITGLYINSSDLYARAALFGYISGATVKDLSVQGSVTATGLYSRTAGIVAETASDSTNTISGCSFSGSVSGVLNVGGIVGKVINRGTTITDCSNSATVTGNESSGSVGKFVGGIVGHNNGGTVERCVNTGAVSGFNSVGGIAGYNGSGTVERCVNTGAVSNTEQSNARDNPQKVGGVVGNNFGGSTVKDCRNSGDVTAARDATEVGGVVGYNDGSTVENCDNSGAVKNSGPAIGTQQTGSLGGIVGTSKSNQAAGDGVKNCRNTGAVSVVYIVNNNTSASSGITVRVGGVVGWNNYVGSTNVSHSYCCTVSGCESTGTVYCVGADTAVVTVRIGGVAGENDSGSTVTDCTFLSTGGNSDLSGVGSGTGTNVSGSSTLSITLPTPGSGLNENVTGNSYWSVDDKGNPVRKFFVGSGRGTEDDPYRISEAGALEVFRNNVNAGVGSYPSAHVTLTADIDLQGSESNQWTPIGNGSYPFTGTFDGGDHTITGLYINVTNQRNLGLFGVVSFGTVKKLKVSGEISAVATKQVTNAEGVVLTNDHYASNIGGIAGSSSGTIEGCSFTGTITAKIDKTTTSDTDGGMAIGSIVGDNSGTVKDCHSGSETTVIKGLYQVGGIAGKSNGNGTIESCSFSGKIAGSETISSSGTQTSGSSLGGIVGSSTAGTIGMSHSDATVEGDTSIGGIIGSLDGDSSNHGVVENCWFGGTVKGNLSYDSWFGGICGTSTEYVKIKNSYSRGSFEITKNGHSAAIGHIVGSGGSEQLTNCYYQVSGDTDPVYGIGSDSSSVPVNRVSAKTAEEFASGEVAWLLQGNQGTPIWGQRVTYELRARLLGVSTTTDPYPVLGGTAVYQVTFTAPDSVPAWTDQVGYVNAGQTISAPSPAPTREHYTFTWMNGTTAYDFAASVTGDLTLTAVWTIDRHTVTWNGNGGTVNTTGATGTADYGTTITAPANPTRTGYNFVGWFTAVNGGTQLTSTTAITADVTYYAHWTENTTPTPNPTPTTPTPVLPTTYPIAVEESEHGSVAANTSRAVSGQLVTLTVTPDTGYILKSLTVTDFTGKAVKLTDNGEDKFTFTMPAGAVTVKAAFIKGFSDVSKGSYYEQAVNWGIRNGITSGIGNDLFDPDGVCSRAQAVTFLWRAAGSPAPASSTMPFTDVEADSYYYDAVLWGAENGVVKGTSETTFSPDEDCTRAHIVAFLFRYAAVTGMDAVTLQELVYSYPDAEDVPAYAIPALNWALANGIVQGYNDRIMPNAACTRAQIITMLYRCAN